MEVEFGEIFIRREEAQIVADRIMSAEKCGDVRCRSVRSDSAMIGLNCGNEVWWGLRGETTSLQPPKETGFVRVQIVVWEDGGKGCVAGTLDPRGTSFAFSILFLVTLHIFFFSFCYSRLFSLHEGAGGVSFFMRALIFFCNGGIGSGFVG